MNVLKLTLAAVALTMGAGAASADASRAPALGAPTAERLSVAEVGMRHVIETRSGAEASFTGQSRPTIFGHDAAKSTYLFPYDHAASAGD